MQITHANIAALANEIKSKSDEFDHDKPFIVVNDGCTLAKMCVPPRINNWLVFIEKYSICYVPGPESGLGPQPLIMAMEKELQEVLRDAVNFHAMHLLREFNSGAGNHKAHGIEIKTAVADVTGIKTCTLLYKDELILTLPYSDPNKNQLLSFLTQAFKDIVMKGCFAGDFICTIIGDEVSITNPR